MSRKGLYSAVGKKGYVWNLSSLIRPLIRGAMVES